MWRSRPTACWSTGNIEAHESVVSFKAVQVARRRVPFDEGQWVTAGTLLAKLDDSDYRQQVAINEAALHVQEQQLASAMQKLEAARATVADDNADLGQKNIDYGRSQKLSIDKIISGDQRDHTETALKQSSAAMQRDVAMERSAQQDIEVAKANIRDASANLELAKIMLGYTTLRAPFSGRHSHEANRAWRGDATGDAGRDPGRSRSSLGAGVCTGNRPRQSALGTGR